MWDHLVQDSLSNESMKVTAVARIAAVFHEEILSEHAAYITYRMAEIAKPSADRTSSANSVRSSFIHVGR
jgi:hypothetical protein